jgi:hypothetical protein
MKSNITMKKHNACLWQVVLMLVLRMPYYRCYSNIIQILPIKSLLTTLEIQENWSFYRIMNYDKLKPYLTTLRTKIDEQNTAKTIVTQGQINMKTVYDFINQTGEFYNHDDEDQYLKKKLHIKDKKHEWVNDVGLCYSDSDDDSHEDSHDEDDSHEDEDDSHEDEDDSHEDEDDSHEDEDDRNDAHDLHNYEINHSNYVNSLSNKCNNDLNTLDDIYSNNEDDSNNSNNEDDSYDSNDNNYSNDDEEYSHDFNNDYSDDNDYSDE